MKDLFEAILFLLVMACVLFSTAIFLPWLIIGVTACAIIFGIFELIERIMKNKERKK